MIDHAEVLSYLRHESRHLLDHSEVVGPEERYMVLFRSKTSAMDGAVTLEVDPTTHRFTAVLEPKGKAGFTDMADTYRAVQSFIEWFKLSETL